MPPFLMSFIGASAMAGNGGRDIIRSAVTRAVGFMTGAFISGIRLMFTSIVSIIRVGANTITNLVGSVFKGAFGVMKVAVVGLGAAVGGTAIAMKKAVDTIKQLGNQLSDIRASGYGSSSAGAIQRNFRAFGLTPDFGNLTPEALSARTGAWGLPGVQSQNFLPALASQYKNSDPYMRQYLLESLNMNNAEMRRFLMTPQGMINNQVAFQNRVQSGLGVDPREVEMLAQRTDAASAKLKFFSENVMLSFGTKVMPKVLAIVEPMLDKLAAKSGDIESAIDSAVTIATDAVINVAVAILKIPEAMFALADSTLAFVETGIKALPVLWNMFLVGVSVVQSALGGLVQLAQDGFSTLIGLGQQLGGTFVTAADLVIRAWGAMKEPATKLFNLIIDFIEKLGMAAPALIDLMTILGAVPHKAGEMAERAAKGLGANDNQSALAYLAGGAAGWQLLKRAPGWLWNAGKGALGFGGGAAAANAGGAAANPGMWARFLASPAARYGGIALRSTMSLVGAGGLFDVGAGAAAGAARGAAAGGNVFSNMLTYGARGAATGAAQSGIRGILNHPYARIVLAGGALGAIGYETLANRTGMPTLGDMGRYAWNNTIGGWFGGGGNDAAAPNRQGGRPLFPGFMPMMGGLATMGINALGSLNTNPQSSTWAMALDERFGPMVQGFSDSGLAQIGELRKYLDGAREKYNTDELERLLREVLGEQKKQTKYAEQTAKGIGGVADTAAGYALLRYAKESGMAMRRQS